MGGGDAPEADPRIGKAALRTAALGEKFFKWMAQRTKTTDRWASQDRARDVGTFRPLQDRFIHDAETWDSPARQAAAARQGVADVRMQGRIGQDMATRDMAAAGINPASGRFAAIKRALGIDQGLAAAGAANLARNQVRTQGMGLRGDAINLGSGLGINPLSAFTAGTQALGAGADAAIGGNRAMGGMLTDQYNAQMQGWAANQELQGAVMGALGTGAGMLPWGKIMGAIGPAAMAFSDEKLKKNREPARGVLKKVRDMPVEEWDYKKGVADEGHHTGPMAQDFKAATGKGDGKTIPVIDEIGMALGAIKELDRKVDMIARATKARGITRKAA